MAIQFNLVRAEDLLNVDVRGDNLRLNAHDPAHPVLEVEDDTQPAYLIFTFPPQTITERAYFEAPIIPIGQDPTSGVPTDPDAGKTVDDPPLDAPGYAGGERPIVAMLGRPSRLVFKVPPGHLIPFTSEGILDWSGLELSVHPIAAIGRKPTSEQIASAPAISAPVETETALELPYHLTISPTAEVMWNHRLAPFTHAGRTELWHTRLQLPGPSGRPQELSPEITASMRAIWSTEYNVDDRPGDDDPHLDRTAMSPYDRQQIVILTSAFHGYQVDQEVNFGPLEMDVHDLAGNGGPAIDAADVRFVAGSRLINRGQFTITVPYVPEPFEARQLMLTPLGGWLKSRGVWNPPHPVPPRKWPPFDPDRLGEIFGRLALVRDQPGPAPEAELFEPLDQIDIFSHLPQAPTNKQGQLDLSEWIHIATEGRDHYVRIVYEGELWPFRHKAALVKVTERKFRQVGNIVGAYLIQRMFIVVREPEKIFTTRGLPFKKVRLTTLVTPDIADPQPYIIAGTNRSFWVEVLTGPNTTTDRALFQFHAVGTDQGDEAVDFTIPMMFVSIADLPEAENMQAVAQAYNAAGMIAERQAVVPGQEVTFAAQNGAADKATDNTQLVAETLNFVVNADLSPPQLLVAAVKVPQVNEMLGTDDTTDIRYYQGYVTNGFDAASGAFAEIAKLDLGLYQAGDPFAGIVGETLGVDFRSDQAGGFATPDMAVSTLTRELGPLAAKAADALADAFNPADFFGDGLAFLFGTFDLGKLVKPGSLGVDAPHLTTRTEDIPGGKKLIACFDWQPKVDDLDLGVAAFVKDYKQPSTFTINGCIEKEIKLDGTLGGEPTFDMIGKLTNFQVSVLKTVFINFTEFSFENHSGQKTDVKVKLDPATPLKFDGDLKFVEELRDAIPPDLFGDGPSLDISPTGITAGFAFALPPVAVGVFALKDVMLGAALTLPFLDGKPVFDFNVSERAKPFLLSVGIFGGGGFFRLQLDTAGMKLLEASFEFGATAALDIGVASGEVHIMAGIYFALERKEGGTDLSAVLSGYLRMGGSLNVLGLVKVSVEFNLSFTYDSGTEKAYGRATLTVHVEVLFFSASVELTVERAFGGESGDPTFVEMYDTADRWNDYALAFA